jgi:hypothetical protein
VSSRGTTLCLLYTIYLPEERSCNPSKLSMPGDISTMSAIKSCLQDFVAQAQSGSTNEIAYRVFDRDYGSYDRISGNDSARRAKLVQAALEVGVHVYYAQLRREEHGTAEGWVEPEDEDREYWGWGYGRRGSPDEPELDIDSDGNYVMEDGWKTSTSVQNFYNIRLSKAENKHLFVSDPDEEQFIPDEPEFSTRDPDFKQTYDEEGGLTNTWTRSTLIMWPRELHAETVIKLFGWKCAYLLDMTAPVDGDCGDIQKQSIDIAEKFLLSPGVRIKPGYRDNETFRECRRLFFKFSHLFRRFDLFASTWRKFGLPESDEEFALLREAVDTFSSTGNQDSQTQLIDMCLASEPNAKKQLELVIKIFGQQVVAGFITKHFAGKELGTVFTVEDLLKVDKETLRNVYDTLLFTRFVPVLMAAESSRELDAWRTRITGCFSWDSSKMTPKSSTNTSHKWPSCTRPASSPLHHGTSTAMALALALAMAMALAIAQCPTLQKSHWFSALPTASCLSLSQQRTSKAPPSSFGASSKTPALQRKSRIVMCSISAPWRISKDFWNPPILPSQRTPPYPTSFTAC